MQACDKTPLVQRLAVDDLESFRTEPWRGHLTACRACRREVEGFQRSLALYRALEAERLQRIPPAPSWERFSQRLQARTVMERRRRTVRVPVAAAVAGFLVLAGAVSWSLLGGSPVQQAGLPLAVQAGPQTTRQATLGNAGGAAPVLVEPAAFGRAPFARADSLRGLRLYPADAASQGQVAARRERRAPQLPWVDAHVAQSSDLLNRPFMHRGNDLTDPALLAPLTPFRPADGGTTVNFASYAGNQRR